MNKDETKAAAEVMLHFAAGGKVEYRRRGGNDCWHGPAETLAWDWYESEYRIFREPVEFYAVVEGNGRLISTTTDENQAHNTAANRPSERRVIKVREVE